MNDIHAFHQRLNGFLLARSLHGTVKFFCTTANAQAKEKRQSKVHMLEVPDHHR